jgi:hypothetical protein
VSFEQVTLGLAITASILAVLGIVLTVWFFRMQTNDVKEAAKERSKFSQDMHGLLGEIRGKVYTTQEQVQQQYDRLLNAFIEKGSREISGKTAPLIEDVQRLVDEAMKKQPRTDQVKAEELTEIKRRLNVLATSMVGIAQSSLAQSSTEIRNQGLLPPNRFYGTVTIDGKPAPDGTPVFALADVSLWSTGAKTSAGRYTLDVQSSGKPLVSKQITFMIGDLLAQQTAVWQMGANTNLDLSAKTR